MSGVIDKRGQQWEHCNICSEFVRIQDLGYEKPSKEFEHGRDVCIKCVQAMTQKEIQENIEPAKTWIPVYE